MIPSREITFHGNELSTMYLNNSEKCQIPMATISNSGVAQVWFRDSRTFELDNMRIEKIILPDANWIGFLGYR